MENFVVQKNTKRFSLIACTINISDLKNVKGISHISNIYDFPDTMDDLIGFA